MAVTLAVVADRIEDLRTDICQLVSKVEEQNTGLNNFKLESERRYGDVVKDTAANTKDIANLWATIANQSKEIKDLTDSVSSLKNSVEKLKSLSDTITKLVWGLLIPLLLSGIGFLVALLTHKIAIISTPLP